MRYRGALLTLFLSIGGISCKPADPDALAGVNVGGKPVEPNADAVGDGSGWDLKPPAPDAIVVDAWERLPGIYPAGTRVADNKALGGFGPCENYPKSLGTKAWGEKGTISLIAFPDEPVAYFKHRGIALRLVNRTDAVAAFSACDSQLYIVQEARDAAGQWREIETLPEVICGNSFHRVFLKADQYWEFKARTYSGSVKTRLRFRLDRAGEDQKAGSLFSSEFEGEIAMTQLRQGR